MPWDCEARFRLPVAVWRDLMEAFFQEVTTAARRGQPVFYPAALQKAQRSVRSQDRWAAPFYWAPFVLVGAAD